MSNHLKINKINWDERADIHMSDPDDWYGVKEFLAGSNALNPIEKQALGDLAGLKVLHLQCHIGLDTLSIARDAQKVVGVDFSSNALAHARDLAERSGLSHKVTWIESDALSVTPLLDSDFDLAFASWGATCWLPDIFKWANVMASALKPGGRLYYIDAHPGTFTLEYKDGKLTPTYDYRTPRNKPLRFHSEFSYNESNTRARQTLSVEWMRPISDYLSAIRQAGLDLEDFQEHEFIPWRGFPIMERSSEDRQYRLPPEHPRTPLAFSFWARKID